MGRYVSSLSVNSYLLRHHVACRSRQPQPIRLLSGGPILLTSEILQCPLPLIRPQGQSPALGPAW